MISKFRDCFATLRIIPQNWRRTRLALQFDREDVKDSKQLPAQQENGEQDNENGHQFAEGESAAIRFKTPRGQAQDIQRRESKNNRPENVVNIVAAAGWRCNSSNAVRTTGTRARLYKDNAAYLVRANAPIQRVVKAKAITG